MRLVDSPMAASLWYCASKKFAEKTAWEIAESSNFTLSTICPPMVFGPPLHNVDSLDALNTSSGAVYGLMKKDGSSSKEVPETAFPAVSPKFMRRSMRSRAYRLDSADITSDPACASRQFADVRNVAEAHFKSSIEGKNERYLVCNGTFTNQTIVDSIRDRYPDLKDRLAEGKRGEKPDGKVFTLDASKAEKELGLRCKSCELFRVANRRCGPDGWLTSTGAFRQTSRSRIPSRIPSIGSSPSKRTSTRFRTIQIDR
jgi:nucleoside-diphosphate-sugar epimerase